MKYLVLVGVLAGSAQADGVVVAARVGYAHFDECPGCEDTPQPAWGIAVGLEGGYAFAAFGVPVRAGVAVDLFHANSTVYDMIEGAEFPIHYNLVSASAKIQLDVVPEYLFLSAALGEAVDAKYTQAHGLRYELGIGARVPIDVHDAVRFDATYARYRFQESEEQYGVAIGFEHFF